MCVPALSSQTQAKVHVYLVIVFACIAASTVTYVTLRNQEENDFRTDFRLFANEITRSAVSGVNSKINVADVLSIHAASYARDNNLDFPNVTIPDFELRARKARAMSQAGLVMLVPLVRRAQVQSWESYAQREGASWIAKGLEYQQLSDVDPGPVPLHVHGLPVDAVDLGGPVAILEDPILSYFVAPFWQAGPSPINATVVNTNLLEYQLFVDVAANVIKERKAALSRMDTQNFFHHLLAEFFPEEEQASGSGDGEGRTAEHPSSIILDPVFGDPMQSSDVVAFHGLVVRWGVYFQNILPVGRDDLHVVLSDSCGGVYTFLIRGPQSIFLGQGDLHNKDFTKGENLKESAVIANASAGMAGEEIFDNGKNARNADGQCQYVLDIYPTEDFEALYMSTEPYEFALSVACLFAFILVVFLVYDVSVRKRQRKIAKTAKKSLAIVTALFPKTVRDRILKDAEEEVDRAESTAKYPLLMRGNRARGQLSDFLKGWSSESESEDEDEESYEDEEYMTGGRKSKPIADLFPEATVVFADIVGFTAWSSTREPPQVFLLLEAVYQVFDAIASRRRVFKVETVGDCYVAVAGLPEPRKDHALTMAKFARDCLVEFNATTKALVVELGPDTEELKLRVGVHTGPVIAGVLRGKRARFQLFGDTMNTTARMESTGEANRIQVSQETADLLVAEGKGNWLTARAEKVDAKGKGKLQTYWLNDAVLAPMEMRSSMNSDTGAMISAEVKANAERVPRPTFSQETSSRQVISGSDKYNRLVAWNFDILSKLLRQVVVRRASRRGKPDPVSEIRGLELHYGASRYILSEVQEIVRLPKFEHIDEAAFAEPKEEVLSDDVLEQLRDYVQTLAAMYRDNPFHNFEHASHVTMSVVKLLSRIVAPDVSTTQTDTEEALHDHTYGITSDPMTQFAVALSALVHDVDHTGVPNSQLIKEKSALAVVYRNKSVAEQNSVDLAWDVLMDEGYSDLRGAIYSTKAEFIRFRHLVVNLVLATDIMDKDLAALRRGRWNKAFAHEDDEVSAAESESGDDAVNRKATIVMEHIIQASDVAHTMQHWQIYRKWNQRFFFECYEAFLAGRAEKDPSEGWFEGEKGFFDFYILPLARKLKDCGVFGVSSDEYLQYALQNRKEWERKGKELVSEMLEAFQRDHGTRSPPAPLLEKSTLSSSNEGALIKRNEALSPEQEQIPEQAPISVK